MEDLKIQLDFTVFVLSPRDYTFDRFDWQTGKTFCQVTVVALPDSQGLYILGDPFMRSFTTTFDYQNNKMELSLNPSPTNGASAYTVMTNLTKFLIVLAVLLVLGILGVLCYFCYKKCKRDRHAAR